MTLYKLWLENKKVLIVPSEETENNSLSPEVPVDTCNLIEHGESLAKDSHHAHMDETSGVGLSLEISESFGDAMLTPKKVRGLKPAKDLTPMPAPAQWIDETSGVGFSFDDDLLTPRKELTEPAEDTTPVPSPAQTFSSPSTPILLSHISIPRASPVFKRRSRLFEDKHEVARETSEDIQVEFHEQSEADVAKNVCRGTRR